ncbi:MAG TPA: MFS transporter [Ktedonobacteraceae bacterium]|nr:MFS transporter [Ktedonobacteraceae bacterium]
MFLIGKKKEALPGDKPASLWRNRDYLLLLSGQVVSNVGTQVSTLAFPLLILALTGSPAQAGFVGTMRVIPYLLLSLPAGALVDRWDRKRVMILCDTGRAFCLASIPIAYMLGHLTLVQLYLVSLFEGILFVFFNLAEVACLPRVVGKGQLAQATAQNVTVNSVSYLAGPALGGVLYGLGKFVPFLTDALSYVVSVVSLLFIKVKFQGERIARQRSLWFEIKEGLNWLWHEPLIRFIGVLGSAVHLMGAGIIIVIILLAQHLHASTFVIGVMLAMDGVGSITGAFIGGKISKRFRFQNIVITTMWLWAIIWPLLAFASNIVMLAALLCSLYLVITIFDVTQFSYRVALIPDELQGRVNGVYRMILFGGDTVGLMLVGVLLQTLGTFTTILIYGAGIAIVALVATLNPHMRRAQAVFS